MTKSRTSAPVTAPAPVAHGVTDITRTENGVGQFCRGGLESGCSHTARTYTTVHYGKRRFHFCDEHPHDVVTPSGEPYSWT